MKSAEKYYFCIISVFFWQNCVIRGVISEIKKFILKKAGVAVGKMKV